MRERKYSRADTSKIFEHVVHTVWSESTFNRTEEGFGSKVKWICCTQIGLTNMNKEKANEGFQVQANVMEQSIEQKFPLIYFLLRNCEDL